jgi:hypothetical protein
MESGHFFETQPRNLGKLDRTRWQLRAELLEQPALVGEIDLLDNRRQGAADAGDFF